MLYLLAGALALSAPHRMLAGDDHADHDHDLAHGHGRALCGCEKDEADHPFTIDCTNPAPIRAATATLESDTCSETRTDEFEWGASFDTPDASYKWVSQSKDGAWGAGDPGMKLVLFSVESTTVTSLFSMRDTANTLMQGTCTSVSTAGSIPKPTASGVCVNLVFPAVGTDMIATIDTAGVDHTMIFAEHLPTEFEDDTHYLMEAVADNLLSTTATPNEPISDTDMYCKIQQGSDGVKTCQQAFFILQSHHDYCSHDFLTRYEEELVHVWENKCLKCGIERGYDSTLNNCPVIDCTDTSVIDAAYYVVAGNHSSPCIPADTSVEFEWGGSFDTPDASYKWVSQAVNGAWGAGDPGMKMVLFSLTATNMGTLFMLQEEADTIMASGDCSTVITTGGAIPKPTASGVCVTLTFPAVGTDMIATINTAGVDKTAIFAEHLPTEFEDDTHYLMEAVADNLLSTTATPNEPINEVPTAGGHDHAHRRKLSAGRKLSTSRRLSQQAAETASRKWRSRRMASTGQCCNTAPQQGAWKQIVAYHDLCDHDDVPTYVEVGFHDYEASCENYFCNAVAAGYDGTTCPAPPAAEPLPESAVIGIAVAAGVAGLALIFILYMINREKSGKPIFYDIKTASSGVTTASATSA